MLVRSVGGKESGVAEGDEEALGCSQMEIFLPAAINIAGLPKRETATAQK